MIRKGSFLKRRILCSVLRVLPSEKRIASADYAQDPPVPIPNTEVKLSGAENTCLETDREDRLVLALLFFYLLCLLRPDCFIAFRPFLLLNEKIDPLSESFLITYINSVDKESCINLTI